jgi:hypothetical protein
MTPKEKAIELVEKYQKLDIEIGGQYDGYLTMKINDAKLCALIAVDELISYSNEWDDSVYWQQVKSEIKAL